ncbi:MAG TPA: glycosyltransferase family 2 protein [Spirochaetia bacterium]|nr:glycosyltransferase family 2 protein [Spirochaetia bacterium]
MLSRNEEGTIRSVLQEVLRKVHRPFEILVVDDSADQTRRIVRQVASRHPQVHLVRQHGKGYTAAFRTAAEGARGEALVILVGDGSDDPGDIERMRRLLRQGHDVVCASRYTVGGSRIGGNGLHAACSRIVCALVRACTGVRTWDVTNSYKMYRTDLLRDMALQDAGFATSMQVTLRAHAAGRSIAEIPTAWRDRAGGSSKFVPGREAMHYAAWWLWGTVRRVTGLFGHVRRKS